MATGPKSRAPSPVPVGCEQLPVTEGSFSAERTKAKAAATPSSMRCSGLSRMRFLMASRPPATNGTAAIVQPTACSKGKKPSMMCMILSHSEKWQTAPGRGKVLKIGRVAAVGSHPEERIAGSKSTEPRPHPGDWYFVDLGRSSGSPSFFSTNLPMQCTVAWGGVVRLTAAGAAPECLLAQSHRLPVSPAPRTRGKAPKTGRIVQKNCMQ